MIFASSNAKIIELHPDNCGNVCYWHLSRIINNTHIMLLVKYNNFITLIYLV